MSDISIKVQADALGKDIENLAPHIEAELKQAVANLANAAYASMVSQVQGMSMDPKNRQDYLRGLKFNEMGEDNYLIYLEGDWANKLEEGFPSYSMKDTLLSSKKRVAHGSRSGQPWVRESKDGNRYAAVPFEKKPFSGEKFNSGDLAEDIKKLKALNDQGEVQGFTQVFKDLEGKPIPGKVATVVEHENPMLKGLTKFQQVSPSGKVSSVYMLFRTISDASNGWQHPGFKGYHLFQAAEEYVQKELDNILKTLL